MRRGASKGSIPGIVEVASEAGAVKAAVLTHHSIPPQLPIRGGFNPYPRGYCTYINMHLHPQSQDHHRFTLCGFPAQSTVEYICTTNATTPATSSTSTYLHLHCMALCTVPSATHQEAACHCCFVTLPPRLTATPPLLSLGLIHTLPPPLPHIHTCLHT